MSQDDWERARRGIVCANCGASNWPDAEYCASCGMSLADAERADETIIDVSSGEPQIVVRDEPRSTGFPFGGFGTFGDNVRGRTVVVRGGGRACLIPLIVLGLLACCSCWLIWQGFDSVF
jgi:hypothetical protein